MRNSSQTNPSILSSLTEQEYFDSHADTWGSKPQARLKTWKSLKGLLQSASNHFRGLKIFNIATGSVADNSGHFQKINPSRGERE